MGDRCPGRRDAGPCARFRRDRRSFPTRCKRQCCFRQDLQWRNYLARLLYAQLRAIPAHHACRRLRRRWPNLRIVLALWNTPPELLTDKSLAALKADAVVTSVDEAVRRIHRIVAPEEAKAAQQAPVPDNDAERVDALKATGVLEGDKREALDALAKARPTYSTPALP